MLVRRDNMLRWSYNQLYSTHTDFFHWFKTKNSQIGQVIMEKIHPKEASEQILASKFCKKLIMKRHHRHPALSNRSGNAWQNPGTLCRCRFPCTILISRPFWSIPDHSRHNSRFMQRNCGNQLQQSTEFLHSRRQSFATLNITGTWARCNS